MRRMTTGLVFTLSATCSDLRGSSPDQAIKLRTCTATAKRLLGDISRHRSHFGNQFCNHYSYNFAFVNYLIGLKFFGPTGTKLAQFQVEIVDQIEEHIGVEGLRNERAVADAERAAPVFVAGVAGNG